MKTSTPGERIQEKLKSRNYSEKWVKSPKTAAEIRAT
jgi:hypothetical protein